MMESAFPITERLHAIVKGSTLTLVPNAGHVGIFEQPTAANAAIANWPPAPASDYPIQRRTSMLEWTQPQGTVSPT